MRVAIDIQVLQWPARHPAYAGFIHQCLLALVDALRTAAHEPVLLADAHQAARSSPWLTATAQKIGVPLFYGHIPIPCAASNPANRWRREAAHEVRAAWLQSLRLDAVVVLDAQLGWYEDAVVGTGGLPGVWLCPDGVAQPGPGIIDARAGVLTCDVLVRQIMGALENPCALYCERPQLTPWTEVRPAAWADDGADRAPPAGAGRPRLAYVSPLPPAASGIADYSADLLPALSQYYEIDLIVEQEDIDQAVADTFPVRSPSWFHEHAEQFDRVLYHFGNSPFHAYMVELLERHPGSVVLHDFFLGHLYAHVQHSGRLPQALRRALFLSHGWKGLHTWRQEGEASALARFPCSLEVLARANGVIVHSAHAVDLAREWYGEVTPCHIAQVPLAHRLPASPPDRRVARQHLGIGDTEFVVCSFGYAGAGKMSRELVDAWLHSALADQANARLVLVGGHQMQDDYARQLEQRLGQVRGGQAHITGYVDETTYRHWLAAADVAVQLRAASRGETSRAVLDAMAYQVPVIANAHGAAAELPPECVTLLNDACTPEEIASALEQSRDVEWRRSMGAAGYAYVADTHSPQRVAALYHAAIEAAAREAPQSAAGRARGVVARLAMQLDRSAVGGQPNRRDLVRLTSALLANHPQPQRRQVPPAADHLLSLAGGAESNLNEKHHIVGMSGAPAWQTVSLIPSTRAEMLRGLLVVSLGSMRAAAKGVNHSQAMQEQQTFPNMLHARHLQCVYEDAAMPVDVLPWPADSESHGQERLRKALQCGGYAFIHILGWGVWPVVRCLLVTDSSPDSKQPVLVYDAAIENVAEGHLEAERELTTVARLLLAASDADARRLATLNGCPETVVRYRPGGMRGSSACEDVRRLYEQYLPQSPYVLWEAENDDASRFAWEYMFGRSLAFLRPDERLIVVGGLAEWLETSDTFNRWGGINRSRCMLLPRTSVVALDALRQYAHVRILPWVEADAPAVDMGLAQALMDKNWILTTSAVARCAAPNVGLGQLYVADDPQRFRMTLANLLRRPPRSPHPLRQQDGVQLSVATDLRGSAQAACFSHVRLRAIPALVRRAVRARQAAARGVVQGG